MAINLCIPSGLKIPCFFQLQKKLSGFLLFPLAAQERTKSNRHNSRRYFHNFQFLFHRYSFLPDRKPPVTILYYCKGNLQN